MGLNQDESVINHHWNYFLALESDMEQVTRYVEFNKLNYPVYSIELAHLLFAAASEFEVVAKLLCELFNQNAPRENITDLRTILNNFVPEIAQENIFIPRYGLVLDTPLEYFGKGKSPKWWGKYNSVKHERNKNFKDANLENALLALASLQIIILYYEQEKSLTKYFNEAVKTLKPDSILLKFNALYYTEPELIT
ncbi:hypothetical protein BH20ACI4_BH20ACI4_07970 [soil metagenome]